MLYLLMVSLVVPVAVVDAATGVGNASGDLVGCGVAGDVDGDRAAGDKGGTVLFAVYGVGAAKVLQVRRRVNGCAPGDGVVSSVDGEGVVGDALGAAGERLLESRG